MKVKYLPKKDIDVEICNIYEDRDAVIVQHSDTLKEDTAYNVEALGFKFGIKPTAFQWPYSGVQNELRDIAKSGVMKFGVYVPTDRYRSLVGGTALPDYVETTVSAAGAAYYGKTIGDSKPGGYPNNGQELYDFTAGVKGYDVANGVPGSEGNMDFIREMEFVDAWYMDKFDRKPSSGSDRQGKIGSKEVYMPYYLGIRRTSVSSDHSYNSIERLGFIHRYITSRWENGFLNGTIPAANTALINSINAAFTVNGLFNDFVHWHRASIEGNIFWLHDLYELIYNTVNGRNAWYTGYSEAVEYYWFKRMVSRVRGSFIDGKLHLVGDFDDEFINTQIAGIDKKLLYDRIKQPLSVKIDLTGTPFDGEDIQSSFGKLMSLGGNVYIVDIPFTPSENGLKAVVLSTTATPDYKNFALPSVVSYNNGTITTDIPTKAVLFNGVFTETMTFAARSNEYTTTHDFQLQPNSSCIGLATETGQSILYDI